MSETAEREILYPELEVYVFRGETPITVEHCKEWLGWKVAEAGERFLFVDHEGNKIRTTRNETNRPFTKRDADALAQEHLKSRYRGLNGMTIVIDKYGDTQNGQHRLISLPLAEQLRTQQDSVWAESQPNELTMEGIVVFGVEPDEDVINTIDIGRPRSLEDILYRSPYFMEKDNNTRKVLCRGLSYAIREMWARTQASLNIFTIYPTPAEFIDFLNRHRRLQSVLEFVHKMDKDQCLTRKGQLGLGYWTALTYLMGTSESDPELYYGVEPRVEDVLDFGRWKKAEEFIQEVAHSCRNRAARTTMKAVADAFILLNNPSMEADIQERVSKDELFQVVIKAWHAFLQGKPVTDATLKLKYHTDDDTGVCTLLDKIVVGGIDRDKDKIKNDKDKKGGHKVEPAPTETPTETAPKPPKRPVDEFGFPITYVEEGEQPTAPDSLSNGDETVEETPTPEQEPVEEPEPEPEPKAAPKTPKPRAKVKADTAEAPKPGPAYVMTDEEKALAAARKKPRKQ